MGDEKLVQGVDRLRDDFRHIRECWDNRLVLENRSLWENYRDRRAEILFYGDWCGGANQFQWAIRIPSQRTIIHHQSACPDVDVRDVYDGDSRYEIVVLVLVAEAGSSPEIEVRVPARFYVFENKLRKIGEGSLYQRVVGGGFQVFPFLREREVSLNGSAGLGHQGCVDPIFQSLPKIVYNITNDRAKMFCDWLFGLEGEIKTIRISKDCNRSPGAIDHLIQISGEGGRLPDQRINVVVGPFNL